MAEADLSAIDAIMGQQPQAIAGQPPAQPAPDLAAVDSLTGGGDEKGRMRTDGLTMMEEFVVGLNKLQPEKQAEFLQEQGYRTSIQNGQVKVDRGQGPEDFNPDGFDAGDVARWFPEILIGGIETIATGAKVAGAIAAPVTGGGSLALGSAIGGAAGGLGELAIQAGAKAAGVREEFDFPEVGKQALIGATIPGVVTLGGKALQKGGKALQAAPEARKAVQEAGEVIGAKPTPAQLTGSKAQGSLESLLGKQEQMLGGMQLRKQIAANQEAVARTAEEILQSKSGRSALEVGGEIRQKLTDSITKKIGKAEELYGQVLESTRRVPAVTNKLEAGIEKLAADMRFSTDGQAFLDRVRNKLADVENVEDLRLLRTSIMDEVPPTAAKNVKIVADRLYGLLTEARSNSYRAAVRELKKIGEPGSEKGLEALIGKLDEADRLYAQTAREVTNSLLGKGKHLKGGVKRGAERAIEGVPEEKLAGRLLPKGDAARAAALKKLSPEAFDAARSQLLEDIAQRATRTGQGTLGDGFNPTVIFKEINKMGPEMANMIFGKDGVKKAEALKTFYRSIPRDVNPSGTATALANLQFLSPMKQAQGLSLSALHALLRSREAIGRGAQAVAGSGVAQKTGLAAAFQAGNIQSRGNE